MRHISLFFLLGLSVTTAFGESVESSQDSTPTAESTLKKSSKNSHLHTDTHENDSASTDTKKLQTIITTGSIVPQTDIANIPGHISVVDEKTINIRTNDKVTDIVKKLPGVIISHDMPYNTRPSVLIRGINYGTLVMLDNVILSDLEGQNRILNQISLFDVKRVEVARGAFSSLYGTGAIGGVVNFITQMPRDFEVEMIAGYGSEIIEGTADKNLNKLYFSVANVFLDKRLRVKFSAGLTNSMGYSSFPAYISSGEAHDHDHGSSSGSQSGDTGLLSGITGYTRDAAGNYILGTSGRREYQSWDSRLKVEYDVEDSGILSTMFSISNSNYELVGQKSFIKDESGNYTFYVEDADHTSTGSTQNTNHNHAKLTPFIGSGYGGSGSYTYVLANVAYTHYFDDSELKTSLSSVNHFSYWHDGKEMNEKTTMAGGLGTRQDIYTSSNYLNIIHHSHINENHNLISALQFRLLNYDQLNYDLSNWTDYKSVSGSNNGNGNMAFVASGFMGWGAKWVADSIFGSLSSDLGLRYDYWLNFNNYVFDQQSNTQPKAEYISHISPKASLNYMPPINLKAIQNLIFKTSIGTGFRMPTTREKFRPSIGATWTPSINLKPETGLSFEVGVQSRLKYADSESNYVDVSFYYYQTELYDMIYRKGGGSETNPYTYANAGRGRVNGVELGVFAPIWQNLSLDSSYTLTRARVIENSVQPDVVGNQIGEIPQHVFNISLDYMPGSKDSPSTGVYGSLWAYATSKIYGDEMEGEPVHAFLNHEAQFRINAKVGYIFKSGLDISLSILNITNNRYYDLYQMPGISFYTQARWKFS